MSSNNTARPDGRQAAPIWIPLSVASYWLRLPWCRVIDLVKAGQLIARLVDTRWWLRRDSVRRYAKRHQRHGVHHHHAPDVEQHVLDLVERGDGGRAA